MSITATMRKFTCTFAILLLIASSQQTGRQQSGKATGCDFHRSRYESCFRHPGRIPRKVFRSSSSSRKPGTSVRITEGEKISFAYQFTNVGNAELVIRAANGSCGCTVPEFPKDPIPAGGKGIINVTFDSNGKPACSIRPLH